LNRCIELGAYSQAVTYYKKTSSILQKYKDLNSFQKIDKEVKEIITKVQEEMKKNIANPKTSALVVSEYCSLLMELGHTVPGLRVEYLNS
jgi:hypothetical protein